MSIPVPRLALIASMLIVHASPVRAHATFENDNNPGKDCVSYAPPFLMIIGDAKTITLGEDEIIIRTELESARRYLELPESFLEQDKSKAK